MDEAKEQTSSQGCNGGPQVGQGATLFYPDDRYPYRVIAVAPNGKSVTLQEISVDGLEPRGTCNGLPVFDHTFSEAEVASATLVGLPMVASQHKDGRFYVCEGCEVGIGKARYFRNYAN